MITLKHTTSTCAPSEGAQRDQLIGIGRQGVMAQPLSGLAGYCALRTGRSITLGHSACADATGAAPDRRHVAAADRAAPGSSMRTRPGQRPLATGHRGRLEHGVELHHRLHVVLRLAVVGDPVAGALHRALARVVGGQRQFQLAGEQVEQVAQVARAGADVGARVGQLVLDRRLGRR